MPGGAPTGSVEQEGLLVTSDQDALRSMLRAGQLEPYIRHIRFPFFRNLAESTTIQFLYPITALVGPNGTNKTAILRALQGSPDYENVGNYWFSTDLDIIHPSARHRFIHGYLAKSQGKIIEAIKSRIEKGTRTRPRRQDSADQRAVRINPDYFEPSRPLLSDDMERMPDLSAGSDIPPERVRTRWKAIQKPVVYLDFRSELSAFDKYWFHSPFSKRAPNLAAKKGSIRRWSTKLAEAVETGASEYLYFTKNRIQEAARDLDGAQVSAISEILGRDYSHIRTIRHSFFNVDGYSVLLQSRRLRYSEAFAGSGEFAVVMLVKAITEAPENALILLDEPETSLHPGAQRKLAAFLSAQVKRQKLQIVLSTHAPEVVAELPPDAIKVLQARPSDGKVQLVSQCAYPSEAFFRLGSKASTDFVVFVEDTLAAAIVRKAIRPLGEAVHELVDVTVLPGGAGDIQCRFIPSFAQSSRARCLVLLDGDQRPDRLAEEVVDVPDELIIETLKDTLGGKPQIAVSGSDGNADESETIVEYRRILRWVAENVDYMPGEAPERLLLTLRNKSVAPTDEAKVFWLKAAMTALGRRDWEGIQSGDVLNHQERELAEVNDASEALVLIRNRVQRLLDGNQTRR